MKHLISTRWLANPKGRSHFPHNFGSLYRDPIHCQTEDSLICYMIIYVLPIMLTVECRVVNMFWAWSPLSFNTCLFGVRLSSATKLRMSILPFWIVGGNWIILWFNWDSSLALQFLGSGSGFLPSGTESQSDINNIIIRQAMFAFEVELKRSSDKSFEFLNLVQFVWTT